MNSCKLLQRYLPVQKTLNTFSEELQEYIKELQTFKGDFEGESVSVFKKSVPKYENDEIKSGVERNNTDGLICSTCKVSFEKLQKQREHFKLDWHRYNLKQKLIGESVLTEDQFESQASGELSSISGSDSSDTDEAEDLEYTRNYFHEEEPNQENEENIFVKHPLKKFFVTTNGTLISFYKNVVIKKSLNESSKENMETISPGAVWIYIMLSGGHFAGAVFNKNDLVAHKTFHRYTVRAKRGTVQSVQDKKQGGHAPKSGGATIRRYNEAALMQDIENLLLSWSEYIKKADRIFFRCSTYSIGAIFNERVNLSKNDERLVKVSMLTRRPTLKEVKRIHKLFTTVEMYGNLDVVKKKLEVANLIVPMQQKEKEILKCENISNGLDTIEINDDNIFPDNSDILPSADKSHSPEMTPKSGKKKKVRKGKPERKKTEHLIDAEDKEINVCNCSPINENVLPYWKQLRNWCICDNFDLLETSFIFNDTYDTNANKSRENLVTRRLFKEHSYLNYWCKHFKDTLLHAATRKNNHKIITFLMLNGSDPTVRNDDGKFPYDVAELKETRNEFRRFMAKYPEKYDYKKANIPTPLTEEDEAEQQRKAAEKKRAQSKARKARNKAKKAEERQQKLEEKERQTFDGLSDREKRAVMAERRFASQLTNAMKCSNCRIPIIEKEAFKRYEYKYCSIKCTHEHKNIIGK